MRRGGGGEAFFSFFSLPIQFILLTFAAVKQLAMTYQVNEVLQRIIEFFASFCTLSLVNPDEDTTAEERQNTFTDMMKVGLETLIAE